ncbi:MAG: hypothetical protein JSS10_07040 [Verrucomicrobia bacterium]|nr:hypothetical protein [Verrucomicrobiota bacterium]
MPTNKVVLDSIRWQDLPGPNECPWFESSYARTVSSYVLFTLSTASVGGTYYFSRVSIQPALVRQLTITALVLAVLAVLLRQIPLFGRDPAYILQQRQVICENLQNIATYGYKDIPVRFLNGKEIHQILYADMDLAYSAFEQKHGSEGIALSIEEYPRTMKLKIFQHVKESVSKEQSFEVVWASCSNEKLNVSPDELESLQVNCLGLLLVRDRGNAQAFLQKIREEFLASLTELEVIEYLLQDSKKILDNLEAANDAELLGLGGKVVGLAIKLPPYRELLRARFLQLPYPLLTDSKYQQEREALGIDKATIKETLRPRWESISYMDDKFDGRIDFLASIGREFLPQEWTQKVLSDTRQLSVFEMARKGPELFEKGILTSESASSQDETIQERLEKEIFDCLTWEEFIDKCPPPLLANKWMNLDASPAVAFLVADFIDRNPFEFLTFEPAAYRHGIRYRSYYHKHYMLSLMPASLKDLRSEICKKYQKQKEALKAKNQLEEGVLSLEAHLNKDDRARSEAQLRDKKNELPKLLEELKKSTLTEIREKILPVQPGVLLQKNNWGKIVKKIEANADLCRRFAACLYAHRAEPLYAKLKKDFVVWVETKARAGKLPLVFAWNINIEAENLFKNKFRFINGNQVVPINVFVLHALASQTKSALSGLFNTGLKEVETSEICTNDDTSSFDGLMEFYKTGTVVQFIELNINNTAAITRLWELADRLRLHELQELLNSQFELTVDLPKEDELNLSTKESKSHDPMT